MLTVGLNVDELKITTLEPILFVVDGIKIDEYRDNNRKIRKRIVIPKRETSVLTTLPSKIIGTNVSCRKQRKFPYKVLISNRQN